MGISVTVLAYDKSSTAHDPESGTTLELQRPLHRMTLTALRFLTSSTLKKAENNPKNMAVRLKIRLRTVVYTNWS